TIYAFISLKILRRWILRRKLFSSNVANIIAKQNLIVMFKLSLYPTILLVAYFFPTVNRIVQFFGESPFWILLLHVIGSHSVGLLNAIVYGVTMRVFWVFCRKSANTRIRLHRR